ncbi:MAG: hypothetical protein Q8K63_15845 [Acidimicrobiales bacterium]|nr:hypothetical protein [Acidimicrobiales bacterium]
MGAFIGTGLAFIIGTTAFLSAACYGKGTNCESLPDALVMSAPLPAWVLGALLAFHASASQVRQQYIVELEEMLAYRPHISYRRYPRFTTLQLGLYQPSKETVSPFALSVLTLTTPIFVVVAFTIFVVWTIGSGAGLSQALQVVASTIYLAIFALNLWVIGWVMRNVEFLHEQAEAKLEDTGRARQDRNAPDRSGSAS